MRLAIVARAYALAFLIGSGLSVASATAAEHPLTLDEAIGRALRKNEGLLIERESLSAATAAVSGARGAYDPLLELDGAWLKSKEPVNSSFSGAPPDQLAPEIESTETGLAIRQLLPTGGALSLHARGSRETTDGIFAQLSPAYRTRVGVELRQPLLRDRAIDAARLSGKSPSRAVTAPLRFSGER